MYRKTLYRCLVALALSILLLTPALPVWADGSHPAGLFGWLDGWLASFSSWFSGGEAQSVESLDESEGTAPGDPQPFGDSDGSTDATDSGTSGDEGPSIDPLG